MSSTQSTKVRTNPSIVFKILASNDGLLTRLVSSLMTLPQCPVFIEEEQVYTAIDLPEGQYFGRYHALTCLTKLIEQGFMGNKKRKDEGFFSVHDNYAGCNFSIARDMNPHGVGFIEYGACRRFSAGRLVDDDVLLPPRWFCFESENTKVVCDIKTQLTLVADAMGEATIEMDCSTRSRRISGYMPFYLESVDDCGYGKYDVPFLAYKYYNKLQHIFTTTLNNKHIINDCTTQQVQVVGRRAFDEAELAKFESTLRLMLVSHVENGRMCISEGSWVPQKSTRLNNIRVKTVGSKSRGRSLIPPPPQSLDDSMRRQLFTPPLGEPSVSSSSSRRRSSMSTSSTSTTGNTSIPESLRFSSLGKSIS